MDIRSITIAGTAAAAGPVVLAMLMTGTGIDPAGSVLAILSLGAMTALAAWYPRDRKPWELRVVTAIELCAVFAWMATLGSLASYCLAGATRGFADGGLAAMDRAIGVDWIALYRWYAAQPVLRTIGHAAYGTIFVWPIVLCFALAWSGRTGRAWRFLAANGLALVVTVACFAWAPARSALVHHLGAGGGYLPATGIDHVATIAALRSGTLTAIPLDRLVGMVTFPSFHAVSAVLFVWAAWPVAGLRWPAAAANLTMLAVTPIEGTHYVVDVIAGVLLALLAIAAVERWPAPDARPSLWAFRPLRTRRPRPAP